MHKWDSDIENKNHNINSNEIHILLHHVIFLKALSQQINVQKYKERVIKKIIGNDFYIFFKHLVK